MKRLIRKAFPWFAVGVLLSALAWAVSFGTLPPADFTFDNATEVKTLDACQATGQPEGRVIDNLFEGLLRSLPEGDAYRSAKPTDSFPLTPQPAVAESFDLSEDRKTYTFHFRPTARWSDGSSVTADDFLFTWQRMLHPETASEYAYQLFFIVGAEAYNSAAAKAGDEVEIELPDRRSAIQLFPRGSIVRGKLLNINKPPEPVIAEGTDKKAASRIRGEWRDAWLYEVDITGVEPAAHLGQEDAAKLQASLTGIKQFVNQRSDVQPDGAIDCLHVLPDFAATVGLKAPEPQTLVVTLNSPTPFFPELAAFYPMHPVQRKCIETHGVPDWTKAENIVSNGPFKLKFRRLRDRLRLVKNEHYWNAANVKLNTVDVMAIKSDSTGINMYLNGQIDWATRVPNALVPEIRAARPAEFYSAPMLTVYFYRLNTTRPPLDNKKVRQALAAAVDRQQITEYVTRAGELPAGSLVPPGLRDYDPPMLQKYDPAAARILLEEAGFAGGRGLPRLDILYNFDQSHKEIAEVIQQQWQTDLGIEVGLRNLEWGVYLDATTKLDFDVARAGWIGDYPDPNTFLDMFVTDGANNRTGWSHAEFDKLIAAAATEPDALARLALLRKAEEILLDEAPIIPIYYDVSTELVRPGVKGFFCNPQDMHPLSLIEVTPRAEAKP